MRPSFEPPPDYGTVKVRAGNGYYRSSGYFEPDPDYSQTIRMSAPAALERPAFERPALRPQMPRIMSKKEPRRKTTPFSYSSSPFPPSANAVPAVPLGVPVLPGIATNYDYTRPAPSSNGAFLRHLENHRNYETDMDQSLKSIHDCPICQQFIAQGHGDAVDQMFPQSAGWREERKQLAAWNEEVSNQREPDEEELPRLHESRLRETPIMEPEMVLKSIPRPRTHVKDIFT